MNRAPKQSAEPFFVAGRLDGVTAAGPAARQHQPLGSNCANTAQKPRFLGVIMLKIIASVGFLALALAACGGAKKDAVDATGDAVTTATAEASAAVETAAAAVESAAPAVTP